MLISCSKAEKNKEMPVLSENIDTENMSIIDFMFNKGYNMIIRPDGERKYVGTFLVRDDKICIIYASDAGFYPSLMAYTNEFDTLKIIAKSRWRGSDWADDINGKLPAYYYLIEFVKENSEIKYTCKYMDTVDIGGFQLNKGIVNDDNVNLRILSSVEGEVYGKINKNEIVEVNYIGGEYDEIQNMVDYWFNIKYENNDVWVYGYFLDFLEEIKVK